MMKVNRRSFLQLISTSALSKTKPPNIILVMADDQGYGDLGCYGSPTIRTPHIDRMAHEGIRFTDFYAQPLCGPSRAGLMTGCYPPRNSLNFNHVPRAKTGIHANEVTIAQMLKPQGYATMAIGKWHLGDAAPFLPTRHGFDHWLGLPYSNDMWPYHPKVRRAGPESPVSKAARERAEQTGFDGQGTQYPPDWFPPLPLMRDEAVLELNPDQTQLTSRYTEAALDFIAAKRNQPFFLYLAHSMPHVPLYPGAKFAGKSARGRYGDVIEEIDDGMGRILDLLAKLKLDGNTLVIYTSDNGPWLPYGIDAGSAGPLRQGKGTVYEGGVRVPCIMRWPGKIPAGGVTSEIACNIDFFATFAHVSGGAIPTDRKLDSLNLWPLTGKLRDTFLYFNSTPRYDPAEGRPVNTTVLGAIRRGPWKLHMESKALYRLPEDVGEANDVQLRYPEIVKELEALATRLAKEVTENPRPLGQL